MVLTDNFRTLVNNTVKCLKGTLRRIFMADVADEVGQRRAAQQFGWGRGTICKNFQSFQLELIGADWS